jgi:TonB family protein
MTFTILKSGEITNITLSKSSGSLLIDQSAERAIRAAGRFPPLPSQYDQGRLDIYFEFVINPSAGR